LSFQGGVLSENKEKRLFDLKLQEKAGDACFFDHEVERR
jgi:hypothetical protein